MTQQCPECKGPMANGSCYCRRCAPKMAAEERRLMNEMEEAAKRARKLRGVPPPKSADQVLEDLLSACRAVERNANRLRERFSELKGLKGRAAIMASSNSIHLRVLVERMIFALGELSAGVPCKKGVTKYGDPVEGRRQAKAFREWQKRNKGRDLLALIAHEEEPNVT